MKNGWRVVRIAIDKNGKSIPSKEAQAERARRRNRASKQTSQSIAKPIAADKLAKRHVTISPIESKQPERVAVSPTVETRPSPIIPSTPTAHIPFKNPDLNDQPLHWSPRMFKPSPEMDRHNWTWSDWSSPSQAIEDVSYQTDDWPSNDPIAHLPPRLRDLVKGILALKPAPTSSEFLTESVTADTVRYEAVDIASSFGSTLSSEESARSNSSEFSSWVELQDVPWPPHLLAMWIDSENDRKLCRERGIGQHSPLSSSSASSSDASTHSGSSSFGSMSQLDIEGDNGRQRFEAEMNTRNGSSEGPSTLSASSSDASTHSKSDGSGDPSWVVVDEPKWSDNLFAMFNDREEWARARAMKTQGPPCGAGASVNSTSASDVSTHSASSSDASTPSVLSALPTVQEHFQFLQHEANFTAPARPIPAAGFPAPPPPQHFHTQRQVPAALAEEPVKGSGFGWKSLACVAVAAATVGAGLAYAWLSG